MRDLPFLILNTLVIIGFAGVVSAQNLTFGAPISLGGVGTSRNNEINADTDGQGNWAAVYVARSRFQTGIAITLSNDNGTTWTAGEYIYREIDDPMNNQNLDPAISLEADGAAVAIWTTTAEFGDFPNTDFDIVFSRSDDFGASWTPASFLYSEDLNTSFTAIEPSIASAGDTFIAVFSARETPSGHLAGSRIYYCRSTDGGQTWSPRMDIEGIPQRADYNPWVETDGNGTWLIVWQTEGSRRGTLYRDIYTSISRDDGDTWEIALASPLDPNSGEPLVFLGDSPQSISIGDKLGVVYSGILNFQPFQPYFMKAPKNNLQWSEPVPLFGLGEGALTGGEEANLMALNINTLLAVLQIRADQLDPSYIADNELIYSLSYDDGETWTPAAFVEEDAELDGLEAYLPLIRKGAEGRVLVFFETRRQTIDGDFSYIFVIPGTQTLDESLIRLQ